MKKINGIWIVQTRKQRMECGGRCETTEKIRVLAREGRREIIEAVVLTDTDIDRSGNKSVDRGKGFYPVAYVSEKLEPIAVAKWQKMLSGIESDKGGR